MYISAINLLAFLILPNYLKPVKGIQLGFKMIYYRRYNLRPFRSKGSFLGNLLRSHAKA